MLTYSDLILALDSHLCGYVQGHESVSNQSSLESWEEERKVSKYAESLELLPCSRKVPMDPKEVRGASMSWHYCVVCVRYNQL